MSDTGRWTIDLDGYNWLVKTEAKRIGENFIADCGANDDCNDAEGYAIRIAECHNACLNIESPEITVPELVAVAQRASATCACQATMSPDIRCLSCMARAVLSKTGKKP